MLPWDTEAFFMIGRRVKSLKGKIANKLIYIFPFTF